MTARSVLHGASPYGAFAQSFPGEFPNLYPATAGVILLPFLVLPFWIAAALFTGISTALLAFAVSREGYQRFPIFLALPFWIAAYSHQWSILFAAAFLLPALSFLYLAKPSIGLGVLAARFSQRATISFLIGGAVVLGFSLIVLPHWPDEWISNVRLYSAHMKPPLLMPGGFIALLALFKWRRPEARLIVAMALIPQNIAWYDSVPLLLIPQTMLQSLLMAGLSSIPIAVEVLRHGGSDGVIDLYPRGYELALCFYLPAVAMVLRRPNESESDQRVLVQFEMILGLVAFQKFLGGRKGVLRPRFRQRVSGRCTRTINERRCDRQRSAELLACWDLRQDL